MIRKCGNVEIPSGEENEKGGLIINDELLNDELQLSCIINNLSSIIFIDLDIVVITVKLSLKT